MGFVFDATPMGPSANSYATLAELQAVLDALPVEETAAWAGASANQQERAAAKATSRLELLMPLGTRTTATQALNWPRAGIRDPRGTLSVSYGLGGTMLDSQVVPVMVKQAEALLALLYIQEGPEELGGLTAGLANLTSVTLGPLSFSKGPGALADSDLPPRVMGLLNGLLAAGGGTFRIARS